MAPAIGIWVTREGRKSWVLQCMMATMHAQPLQERKQCSVTLGNWLCQWFLTPPPFVDLINDSFWIFFLPKGTSTTVDDALSIEHYHFNIKSISACATVHHPRKKIP